MVTKAILFDKDGTLFDKTRYWGAIVQHFVETHVEPVNQARVLQKLGIDANQQRQPDSVIESESPAVMSQTIAQITGQSPWLIHKRFKNAQLLFLLAHPEILQLLPDTQSMLFDLHQKGYLLGITTADDFAPTAYGLSAAGLLPVIDYIASGDQFAAKPDPDMLTGFVDRFNIDAHQITVIGDTQLDAQFGSYAGQALIFGDQIATLGELLKFLN